MKFRGLETAEALSFLESQGVQVTRHEEVPISWSAPDHQAPLHIWTEKHGELKLRRLKSPEVLTQHLAIRELIGGFPMPEILFSGNGFLVENWILGSHLDTANLDPSFYESLGQLVGQLAKVPCTLQSELQRWRSDKSLLSNLDRLLDELVSYDCIQASICKKLSHRARTNVPLRVESGFVHADIKPENVLITAKGPCFIDNETLTIGALDFELARIWGLWPMSPHERSQFLTGYSKYSSPKSFILHELFWSIYVLTGSLLHKLRNGLPYQEHLQAVVDIADGELPFTWTHSKRTKFELLGKDKIRVAFLVDYLAIGGQERVCYEMLRALDKKLFSPYLFAFRGGAMEGTFRSLGIPMMIGSSKDPMASTEWTVLDAQEKSDYDRRLAQSLTDNRIDAALVFSWKSAPNVLKNSKVPVAIEKLDGPSLLGKIQDKSGFQWIVAESETLRTAISTRRSEHGFRANTLASIYTSVNLEVFNPNRWDRTAERKKLGLSDDHFVIGFVGRIVRGKNIEFLVEAFAKAGKRIKEFGSKPVLLICGPDGGALEHIQQTVDACGIREEFLHIPPPEDVSQIMATMDTFAMSSLSEGLPSVILEATAMGLPIVSTATGSIPEVILENGLISELGDRTTFANHLVSLFRMPEKRKRMGQMSLRIAGRFASRHSIGRYEELLIDALVKTVQSAPDANT